jgi:CheY-like chemotaxis protein
MVNQTECQIGVIIPIILSIKACLFALLYYNGSYISIGLSVLSTILSLFLGLLTQKAYEINTKDAINKWTYNETRQIRRMVHDLKQPVALLMHLTEEEDFDRALMSSICRSLCCRVKSVNDSLKRDIMQTPKNYSMFDINDVLLKLTDGYSRLFTVRNVDFTFNSSITETIIVLSLIDNIERAVENLLSNANKFVNDGGSVTMSLSCKKVDAGRVLVSIQVADDGKGLTPIDIESMWKDNYKGQVDSIGSGLGLAGIASFSRGEGGDVYAKNNSTTGCTVGFTFICHIEEISIACNHTEIKIAEENLSQKNRTVLLVEDDPLQRRISLKKLTRYTKKQNIHVDIACDGAEGLRMMRDRMYDAVVTDMNMPIMDGITMINNGKREGVLPTIYKLLSAQTFDVDFFDNNNIPRDVLYEKTDSTRNVFKDVSNEILRLSS